MSKKNIKEEEIMPGSYFMDYDCDNCYRNFRQWFAYGQRASQGICPHCGVSPKRLDELPYRMEVNK